MTKGPFGFLEYDAGSLKEALAAGGGAAGLEAAERALKEAQVVKKQEEGEKGEEKEGAAKEEAAATKEGEEESKPSPSASPPPPPPPDSSSSSSHRTKLRVYFRAAEVEAIDENKSGGEGGGEGDEEEEIEGEGKGKAKAPTQQPTVPVLRRGDLVEFTLAEKPKTRESVAHRVRKIGDAPNGGGGEKGFSTSSSRPRLFVAERNPQGIKFTSNTAAGVRGNLAVRLAKCPPEGGARGFTPETSPGSRAELVREYLRVKEEAAAEIAAEAAKLNPKAAEFIPPPGLGAALAAGGGGVGGGGGGDEEAAAAAAVAKLAVVEVEEAEAKGKREREEEKN